MLTFAGAAIAAGDLWLVVRCWKTRSVLAGVLAVAGIPVVVFAIVSGPTRGAGQRALVGALIALLIGAAIYGLGQALERLLDNGPEDSG